MKRKISLAVIGGGPAGLSAAAIAAENGAKPEIFDDNFIPGGQLIKQTHKFFGSKEQLCGIRGTDISKILIEKCNELEIPIHTEASVTGIYDNNIGILYPDRFEELETEAIIIATGASENMIRFVNNELPGIYGAGAIQTLMNVFGVKPADRVLMIGSGNIGLIVSYQLIQAGVEVAAIVEALPNIGGYLVHAAKVKRIGIPIYLKHTILKAYGNEEEGVTGAEISEIDKNFIPLDGTSKKLDVDTICLAVGLTPLSDLLDQAKCEMRIIHELGGKVACHDEFMQTTKQNIFLCGDVSGIEEAVSASLEGKLAGLSSCIYLNQGDRGDILEKQQKILEQLREFRDGPFGEKTLYGSRKLIKEFYNVR